MTAGTLSTGIVGRKSSITDTSEEAASAEAVAGNLLPEPGMDPGYIPKSYICLRACEFYTQWHLIIPKKDLLIKKGNILWYFFCAVVCRIDTTVKWVVVCIEVEDLYGNIGEG